MAERYRDGFDARRVWIYEFFARRDWFGGACYQHGDRFSILSEVQPGGEGSRLLKRELREAHGLSSGDFILAVDCSGSFVDKLSMFEREIVSLSNHAVAVLCFAGSVKEVDPEDVELASLQSEGKALAGGTLLGPLVSELEGLHEAGRSCAELIFISDGEFSDSSNELTARLERIFSRVEWVTDEASLSRVAAERCMGKETDSGTND